jgi:hypothetical protein
MQVQETPTGTALGDWYATALFWKPQLALLVNERTLIPLLMPLAPAATLPERIGGDLARILALHGVSAGFIEREVAQMATVAVAQTRNRRVLGTMNEFAFEAEVLRHGRETDDLVELALHLAQTPCSAMGCSSPTQLLRQIAAQPLL